MNLRLPVSVTLSFAKYPANTKEFGAKYEAAAVWYGLMTSLDLAAAIVHLAAYLETDNQQVTTMIM